MQMAIFDNFALIRGEDAILSVSLNPPTSISDWNLQFRVNRRFGSCSGLIFKSADLPTFNNVSGINVTGPANGQFQITIKSIDTSGLSFGNYAYQTVRQDTNSQTVLNTGFLVLLPSIGC